MHKRKYKYCKKKDLSFLHILKVTRNGVGGLWVVVDSDYSVNFEPRHRLNNSLDSLYWSFTLIVAFRSCYYKAVYLEVSIIDVLTLKIGLVVDVVGVAPGDQLLL